MTYQTDLGNKYQVLSELGRGGMGVVLAALDHSLERKVAIKLLNAEQMRSNVAVQRLRKEAAALSKLKHPNIVKVYRLELDSDGIPFLVMDLVEGQSLSAVLMEKGPIPEAEAYPLFLQICGALSYAHENGVVHRDLKPANVLVTADGTIRIVDFGIAKDTTTKASDGTTPSGDVFGTPAYMSPEQLTGHVDYRSDIYSFGCLMYECLTGKTPTEGNTALEIAAKVMTEYTQAIPGVSFGLNQTILRCLEKNPDKRYQSCESLEDALRINAGRSAKRKAISRVPTSKRSITIPVAKIAIFLLLATACWNGFSLYKKHEQDVAMEPYRAAWKEAMEAAKRLSYPGAAAEKSGLVYLNSIPFDDPRKIDSYSWLLWTHARYEDLRLAELAMPIFKDAFFCINERKQHGIPDDNYNYARIYAAYALCEAQQGSLKEAEQALATAYAYSSKVPYINEMKRTVLYKDRIAKDYISILLAENKMDEAIEFTNSLDDDLLNAWVIPGMDWPPTFSRPTNYMDNLAKLRDGLQKKGRVYAAKSLNVRMGQLMPKLL